MTVRSVKVKIDGRASQYDVRIGSSVLHELGAWVSATSSPSSVAIISNKAVYSLYGEPARRSIEAAGIRTYVHLIGDGERFKNLKTLEGTIKFLSESSIQRSDAVLALGGGVVGDLAGFAAAVHLRGVPFLQVPTTLLAMIDSSVGGKTGVNSAFGKNLIGAFHQPAGVLIDTDVLKTLPRRELTAGLCEAVKHGAISGRKLLSLTAGFLMSRGVDGEIKNTSSSIRDLIEKNIRFKASVVSGDEKESVERKGPKSSTLR